MYFKILSFSWFCRSIISVSTWRIIVNQVSLLSEATKELQIVIYRLYFGIKIRNSKICYLKPESQKAFTSNRMPNLFRNLTRKMFSYICLWIVLKNNSCRNWSLLIAIWKIFDWVFYSIAKFHFSINFLMNFANQIFLRLKK